MRNDFERIRDNIGVIRLTLDSIMTPNREAIERIDVLLDEIAERAMWQAYFADYAEDSLLRDLKPED